MELPTPTPRERPAMPRVALQAASVGMNSTDAPVGRGGGLLLFLTD